MKKLRLVLIFALLAFIVFCPVIFADNYNAESSSSSKLDGKIVYSISKFDNNSWSWGYVVDLSQKNKKPNELISTKNLYDCEIRDPIYSRKNPKAIFFASNQEKFHTIYMWLVNSKEEMVRNRCFSLTENNTSIQYYYYQPAISPDETKLLFTRKFTLGDGEHSEICVLDFNTMNIEILTKNLKTCFDGSWSPNGEKVVYVLDDVLPQGHRYREIRSINIDGSFLKILARKYTFQIYHPIYSPNGKKVGFIFKNTIATIDIAGNNEIQILNETKGIISSFDWINDNKFIYLIQKPKTGEFWTTNLVEKNKQLVFILENNYLFNCSFKWYPN